MLPRGPDRSSHSGHVAVRNDRNLLHRKSFDRVEQEGLAIPALGSGQSELNQAKHFVGIRDVLGSRHPSIGNHAFAD